ncbi:MAG: EamA family transporter [Ignavibacteriae bacterium]|nr:EamA family transporter [Ignavibacteriota bacterium]
MKKQKLQTFLAFGAIYIIWGSTYLATRYAIETIPPLMMIGIRSTSAGIILYFISQLNNQEKIKRENIFPLFILGAMFFLVGHGLLAWAQQYVPSGMAAVLITPEPLWIMGIEWFFLKDTQIKIRGIIGLILGFIGVIYLILTTTNSTTSNNDLLGSALIILGTFSWGGGAVYSRVANLPKPPLLTSGIELIFGGILVLITSFIIGEPSQFHLSNVNSKSFLGLLYLIIFGSVLAFGAYVWLLGRTSVTRISTHTYVNPIIAVFLGWLFANEQITFELLVATVIIIISVYLVLSDHFTKRNDINIENNKLKLND